MSTANVVFKIDEVAKEFGFTLKEKQKNYKRVCLFFCEAFLVAFKFLIAYYIYNYGVQTRIFIVLVSYNNTIFWFTA